MNLYINEEDIKINNEIRDLEIDTEEKTNQKDLLTTIGNNAINKIEDQIKNLINELKELYNELDYKTNKKKSKIYIEKQASIYIAIFGSIACVYMLYLGFTSFYLPFIAAMFLTTNIAVISYVSIKCIKPIFDSINKCIKHINEKSIEEYENEINKKREKIKKHKLVKNFVKVICGEKIEEINNYIKLNNKKANELADEAFKLYNKKQLDQNNFEVEELLESDKSEQEQSKNESYFIRGLKKN